MTPLTSSFPSLCGRSRDGLLSPSHESRSVITPACP
jgi:hypothetical protein